jgi:hypothetical protein
MSSYSAVVSCSIHRNGLVVYIVEYAQYLSLILLLCCMSPKHSLSPHSSMQIATCSIWAEQEVLICIHRRQS